MREKEGLKEEFILVGPGLALVQNIQEPCYCLREMFRLIDPGPLPWWGGEA